MKTGIRGVRVRRAAAVVITTGAMLTTGALTAAPATAATAPTIAAKGGYVMNNGTGRTLARLAKLFLMRFFSVNEYVCEEITSFAINFSGSVHAGAGEIRRTSRRMGDAPFCSSTVPRARCTPWLGGWPLPTAGGRWRRCSGPTRPCLSSAVASEDEEERTCQQIRSSSPPRVPPIQRGGP